MKTSLLLHPQNGKGVLLLGEFPERSNGTDCKSAGYAFGGSNPSLPTFLFKKSPLHKFIIKQRCAEIAFCGVGKYGYNSFARTENFCHFDSGCHVGTARNSAHKSLF